MPFGEEFEWIEIKELNGSLGISFALIKVMVG